MELFITGRAAGKTTKVVEFLKENEDAIVITHNLAEENALLMRGVKKGQIVTAQQVRAGILRGKKDFKVAIDNLELVLPILLGCYNEVSLVTMTGQVK